MAEHGSVNMSFRVDKKLKKEAEEMLNDPNTKYYNNLGDLIKELND